MKRKNIRKHFIKTYREFYKNPSSIPADLRLYDSDKSPLSHHEHVLTSLHKLQSKAFLCVKPFLADRDNLIFEAVHAAVIREYKGLKGWRSSKGSKATYLASGIRQAIYQAIRESEGGFTLPKEKRQILLEIIRIRDDFKLESDENRFPTYEEIAELYKTKHPKKKPRTPDEIALLLWQAESDKHCVREIKKGEQAFSLDMLPARLSDPAILIDIEESKKVIHEMVNRLEPRERKVIQMCFGLSPYERQYTLEEISKELGFKGRSGAANLKRSALYHLSCMEETTLLREGTSLFR